jgi:response regulator RpfG family c-di-GMP phosphodiesterase
LSSSSSKKYTILVVDDEPDNLLLLERVLRREYNVFSANSGAEALEFLEGMDVDMIISDQRMPNMTGAELLGQAYQRNPDQVRILLTAYSDVKDIIAAINAGHIYQYLGKPWDPDELKLTVRRSLESYQLTLDNRRMLADYRNDEAMLLSTFSTLIAKLEERAPHLRGHAQRTKDFAALLARDMKLFGEEMLQLEAAAFLRNLGLLALPDAILNTPPDQLDADQRRRLADHAAVTDEILLPLPFFMRAIPIIGQLDERFDGSGPIGLQGTSIPTLARVLQVAVAFDQAVQGGPGRAPLPADQALKHLESLKGTQLDPELVDRFVRIVAANPELAACPS